MFDGSGMWSSINLILLQHQVTKKRSKNDLTCVHMHAMTLLICFGMRSATSPIKVGFHSAVNTTFSKACGWTESRKIKESSAPEATCAKSQVETVAEINK